MYSLKRFFYHIYRWPRSHGFGIQSPSAFRFVNSIVRERYPYYAYSDLVRRYHEDTTSLAFHRFLLRLSNNVQGQVWVANNLKTIELDYLRAGCTKAELFSSHPHPNGVILDLSECTDSSDDEMSFYNKYVDILRQDSVMVVEGIRRNRSAKLLWKHILSDKRTIQTFDLYDCGVVFFDTAKAKKNYKVMFTI